MKVAGIIAEFNPFHKGHKYLIDVCRQELGADYVVVVMSGDFVQRGAPALLSKFSRARMAINSGADLVLELPVYYSLGSAEYFAEGAVSVLQGLGVVTDLVFGSETSDIASLRKVAKILVKEPEDYKAALQAALSIGESFPTARAKAIAAVLSDDTLTECLSSPNSILAVEYMKALLRRESSMEPHAVKRIGAGYDDVAVDDQIDSESGAPAASALGIRNLLSEAVCGNAPSDQKAVLSQHEKELLLSMPESAYEELTSYEGSFLDCNSFSDALKYKLLLEKDRGFEEYLDVTLDLSNRIVSSLPKYESFEQFCQLLKIRNLTYTRISRCLMHILLNITEEKVLSCKADDFTAYGRILGMKKASSALLAKINESSTIPVLSRLKDADSALNELQLSLFNETLTGSQIYNSAARNGITSEYSLKPVIL